MIVTSLELGKTYPAIVVLVQKLELLIQVIIDGEVFNKGFKLVEFNISVLKTC